MRQARNHSPRCAPLNLHPLNPPPPNPPMSNPPLLNPSKTKPLLPNPPLLNHPVPNPPSAQSPFACAKPTSAQLSEHINSVESKRAGRRSISRSRASSAPLLYLGDREERIRVMGFKRDSVPGNGHCLFSSLYCCIYKKQILSLDELADLMVIRRIHEICNHLASRVCRRVSDASWYDNNSFVLKLPGGMREAETWSAQDEAFQVAWFVLK
ncbi:hypothetical protein H257_13405 [Aphanomyces astaci]|uniref:OTU domain-containing protein n=1 Tax=Aphanomyces astaci TaxID=112090 RepID=W4FUU4_APHAT|nr:hypothetical protein H257_13405 [Aphanomyces astaci]ETV71267.1 hypothetical protein H257_13405 [Aphanomyces astaci]|eukprot:XP_009839207.1 hypothetical protein H257_13405 [Aphanomyces astaci]